MNMNQKGFANIILVVVTVAILIGAVGYFVFVKKSGPIAQQTAPTPTQTNTPTKTPTPTPTPNDATTSWKTYRNDQYGFEFKYPNEWAIPGTQHGGGDSSLIYDLVVDLGCPQEKIGGEGQCSLLVIVIPASSPEKFMSQQFFSSSETKSKISYKPINTIQTVSFTISQEGPIGESAQVTFFGDKYYATFVDRTLSYQENGTYNQILSTFRFTR